MTEYLTGIKMNDFMMKNAWCYNNNSKCYDPYGSTGGNGMPRYDGLSIRCVISGSPDQLYQQMIIIPSRLGLF